MPGVIWNTGLQQQTPAVQMAYRLQMRGTKRTGSSKRRKKKAAAPKRRAKKASSPRKKGKKGNRFTKGSAAAKRHMAKLRKMRK